MRFILLMLSLIPSAASATPTFTAAVTGGTLGIGAQVGVRNEQLGIRVDAAFLGFNATINSDDTKYDGHAELRSYGVMLDLYPFGGGLRLSSGARLNRNGGKVTATPTRNTSIGGFTFTPAQIGTLRGSGSVRDLAPAITFGYGTKVGRGFLWSVDAGALFQGRVRVSPLTSSTGMIPQSRLDAERGDLQDDVGKYKVFPIAQIAAGWRF